MNKSSTLDLAVPHIYVRVCLDVQYIYICPSMYAYIQKYLYVCIYTEILVNVKVLTSMYAYYLNVH